METVTPLEIEDWSYLASFLPADLEESAKHFGVLQRKRQITRAQDLIRIGLVYAIGGKSLEETVAWADSQEIATLTKKALSDRLIGLNPWLDRILTQLLSSKIPPLGVKSFSLRLVDATVFKRPKSVGTDYRLHVSFNLSRFEVDHLELTSEKEGERFQRFQAKPGEILVADRMYGTASGVKSIVEQGAQVVVRLRCNLSLKDTEREKVSLLALGESLAVGEVVEKQVWLGETYGRLFVLRKHPEAAQRERKRVTRKAQKNSRGVSEAALHSADYLFLFTTLASTEATAQEVMALYRSRWQVELYFKRLKSLLESDKLPYHQQERLSQCYLKLKLLAALLIETLCQEVKGFSPWGYGASLHVVSV